MFLIAQHHPDAKQEFGSLLEEVDEGTFGQARCAPHLSV